MKRRKEIVAFAQRGYREGLMTATSGNVSCFDRTSGTLWITPSGLDYGRMTAEDIVCMDLDGNLLEKTKHKPSSEWRMHAEIYRAVPTVQAIVHTHSPNATAFAVLRQKIPCVLVESLLFLGGEIEVAPYAKQGTPEVGRNALPILQRKPCCLLANHGVVTTGETLEQAYHNAQYVEDTAKIVQLAMSTGLPIPTGIDREEG